MGDYDLYADGYIGRCFRLYYSSNEGYNITACNILRINAAPYNILSSQKFELEFYWSPTSSGLPVAVSIGQDLYYPYPWAKIRTLWFNNYMFYFDDNQQMYFHDPYLTGWNKIKIKYANIFLMKIQGTNQY